MAGPPPLLKVQTEVEDAPKGSHIYMHIGPKRRLEDSLCWVQKGTVSCQTPHFPKGYNTFCDFWGPIQGGESESVLQKMKVFGKAQNR